MTLRTVSLRRLQQVFCFCLALSGILLHAQLDPKLQTCKTDFLDLFQQSSNARIKPEVMTIFDFSGSMSRIMFHPLYKNMDINDTGGSAISFELIITTATPPVYSVKATLKGSTIASSKLTSLGLVKPNGTLVTATDADASAAWVTGSGFGKGDVRNWIRAASHARFTYTDGTTVRTVDVPLPWKITDAASTGNPLSSLTVLDHVDVPNPDGTVTSYGSNTQIDVDTCYALQGTQRVINGTTNTTQTVQQLKATIPTNIVDFVGAYVDWLFKGKYTEGSYLGKYITYDAANATLAGGQTNVAWGQGYGTFAATDTIKVPVYKANGTYANTEIIKPASANVVPARTRVQAVKESSIRTWITYQGSVFWAYRFLDRSGEAGSGTGTTINANSKTNLATGNPTTTKMNGVDSGWTLLNGNSIPGMKRIAALFADGNTPLTYAMARGLAQYTDPNNVFNTVETGADAPPQCIRHYLILFTDGLDNNGESKLNANSDTPYMTTSGGKVGTATEGNARIIADSTKIDRYGSWWNLHTYAGIGAHMGDESLASFQNPPVSGYSTGSVTPHQFLPFVIKQRSGVTFLKNHRVQTMTVGVGLGGQYTNPASPKYRLFVAAAIGDPAATSWNLDTLEPFALADPSDPTAGKKAGSICFFDATDPAMLTQSLNSAFQEALKSSNSGVTSNPNLPFVGASLGNQVYLGTFRPPSMGGVFWKGDLLMFPTQEQNGQPVLLDGSGNLLTTAINENTAGWSAMSAIKGTPWRSRKLYTRLPATASNSTPALTEFSDQGTAFDTIKAFVASNLATDATKQKVIQHVAGGNITGTLDASNRPTTNRDNIMGDIINSAPAAIEYKWEDVQGSLPAALNGKGNRFRLILVGTNQGWLHAFGEVSKKVTRANGKAYVQGAVAELWAFMPTDFLAKLDYTMARTNAHRAMVDGEPVFYHLDRSNPNGGPGNGVVDKTERALAIFGLRKGGRSYYALNVQNPFSPTLQWTLVPDEADTFGADKTIEGGPELASIQSIAKQMGYSSCTPGVARCKFKDAMHDALFLGGGYSTPEVEANFLDPAGNPMPLGRSVMALDAYTGQILAAVNLKDIDTTVGPVSTGVIPIEFFIGSKMTQRAYFTDVKGGLWAWGSNEIGDAASGYQGYRYDTSDIAQWTTTSKKGIRKVYQDTSGKNAIYSTMTAPFRVGAFPGRPKTAGMPVPPVAGIALVSGDRNNPVDLMYTPATQPTGHRLTMIFDRQDSSLWGLDPIPDSDLVDFSSQNDPAAPVITPGNNDFYLAPQTAGSTKFGYYINFPTPTPNPIGGNQLIPKGINDPMVVDGSLFYSIFTPTAVDICAESSGKTETWRICDVYRPVHLDTRTNVGCNSGKTFTWNAVASNFVNFGNRGVLQGGVVRNPSADSMPAGEDKNLSQLTHIGGKRSSNFPKIRIWRTIR